MVSTVPPAGSGTNERHAIDTAPTNQRVLIEGRNHVDADEMAMAWLDRIDNRWYYAPQGGLVQWNPTHWRKIPGILEKSSKDSDRIDWLEAWHDVPGKQHGYGDTGVALITRASDGFMVDSEFGGGTFDTFREAVDAASTFGVTVSAKDTAADERTKVTLSTTAAKLTTEQHMALHGTRPDVLARIALVHLGYLRNNKQGLKIAEVCDKIRECVEELEVLARVGAVEKPDSTQMGEAAERSAVETHVQSKLTVWYGSMPESNGRTNWTAILHRGKMSEGYTIDRSQYPGRVHYAADRVRWLLGELDKEPWILDYDGDECTPCHLCGGTGEKDGKPCWGLNFVGTVHDVEPAVSGSADVENSQ